MNELPPPGKEASQETSGDPTTTPADTPSQEDAMRVAARALSRVRTAGDKAKRPSRRARRPGASPRDPQLVGAAVDEFLNEQGWEGPTALARLAESWSDVVGPELAAHVVVESWSEGELVLRADSTAWATQVRLLSDTLRQQIHRAVGEELVATVTVLGPTAPSWRSGPRVVKGRGPRDTYG